MSARLAALALRAYDPDVAEAVWQFNEVQGATWAAAEALALFLRQRWTLSLAARAAGTTEEKVVAALLLYFTKAGPSEICRKLARGAFK